MSLPKPGTSIFEPIACSLSLMIFAFFVHFQLPVKLVSFASLCIPAYIIGKNITSLSDIKKITGEASNLKSLTIYSIAGLVTGLILSVTYRRSIDAPLFPEDIKSFAIVASMIGSMEELIFRGYIQQSVRGKNGIIPVLFSTTAHTGYKCALFLSPFNSAPIDIGFLAFWTFLAGLILGVLRHLSGSVVPSLSAHALFDILVYGELISAPWWVW